MSLLTSKTLWMLVLLICLLGVIGLTAFSVEVPDILEKVIAYVMGLGSGGAVLGSKKTP